MRGLTTVRCWTVEMRIYKSGFDEEHGLERSRRAGSQIVKGGSLWFPFSNVALFRNGAYPQYMAIKDGNMMINRWIWGLRFGWGSYIQLRLTRSRADSVALRLRSIEDSHSCCTVTFTSSDRKRTGLESLKLEETIRNVTCNCRHQVPGCSCVSATFSACVVQCAEYTTTVRHPTTLRPVMIPFTGSARRLTCCLMGYMSAQSEPRGCRTYYILYQVFVILRKGRLWIYYI